LYLPKAPAASPAVETQPALHGAACAKQETILVVEDEPAVRAIAVSMLESLGYRVRQAADGQSALDLLETADDVDLLFTDIVMPNGMSGHDLLGKARKLRPDLRVLFTSGYSEHWVRHRGDIDRTVALLDKPYRKRKMAEKIREALDRVPA
jgi:CheY-like chemotaxis protein